MEHKPETIALADAILVAAGSGLRHYTPHSRERILNTAQVAIEQSRLQLLESIEAFLADHRNTYDGEPLSLEKCEALEKMRNAAEKARGQS